MGNNQSNEQEEFRSPPGSFTDFVVEHYRAKVTNPNCECCGNGAWTPMMRTDNPNDVIAMPSGEQLYKGKLSNAWNTMGFICSNCHHIRWFAVQTLLNEWMKLRGHE